jgi:hypothetical protein
MSRQPQLFPSFKKWYRQLSHLFSIAPTPIRIAFFPTFVVIGAMPLALLAMFSPTSTIPKAYLPVAAPPLFVAVDDSNQPGDVPQAPLLQTKTLAPAIRHQLYLTTITAEDLNLNDQITLSISGLPDGIQVDVCKPTQTIQSKRITSCTISGEATARAGIYPVTVIVSDSANLTTRYTINLEVIGKPSLFELF